MFSDFYNLEIADFSNKIRDQANALIAELDRPEGKLFDVYPPRSGEHGTLSQILKPHLDAFDFNNPSFVAKLIEDLILTCANPEPNLLQIDSQRKNIVRAHDASFYLKFVSRDLIKTIDELVSYKRIYAGQSVYKRRAPILSTASLTSVQSSPPTLSSVTSSRKAPEPSSGSKSTAIGSPKTERSNAASLSSVQSSHQIQSSVASSTKAPEPSSDSKSTKIGSPKEERSNAASLTSVQSSHPIQSSVASSTKAPEPSSDSKSTKIGAPKTERSNTASLSSVQSSHPIQSSVTSATKASEKSPAPPFAVRTISPSSNSSVVRNTNISQSNSSFELQLVYGIGCLGLALFSLAVLTCPPVASVLGMATAFTKTVSAITGLLVFSGLFAYQYNKHRTDRAETPTVGSLLNP